VTLDFWGTLVQEGPRTDDRYKQHRLAAFEVILAGAGLRVSLGGLARGYEASARELAWVWAENRDVPVLRHVTSILEGAEAGLSARVSEETLEALVGAYCRPALLVPPAADEGAGEALRALAARGLRLAVVSNTMRTPGSALRKILEAHGILRAFAYLVFSDEVGVRKPAAEIFHVALREIGVDPAEAVHVGDDATLDVLGARNAGLRVIQVLAPGRAAGPPEPDLVIEGLRELPRALARLEGQA
jgi:putative hydrolase of the HAD superfamily